MNSKPESKDCQPHEKATYDINQTVHTKVNSSYQAKPNFSLEILMEN